MAHDVFISYSSKAKPIADAICAGLEGASVRCWVAPRDIAYGDDWPTAIAQAISHSRIMVLVFSANANASNQISRELSLAADSGVIILPFKIDHVDPEPGKQYFLVRTHWLDAMNPPTNEQIQSVVERVKAIRMGVGASRIPSGMAAPLAKSPAEMPVPPAEKRLRLSYGLIAGALIVLALLGGILIASRTLSAPAATLVPTAIAIAPSAAPATAVPSAVSATHTLPPPLVLPTTIASPTAVPPMESPSPTVRPAAVPPGTILFQEHFDDPKNEGSLPPSPTQNSLQQPFIQRNGVMLVPPTQEGGTAVNLIAQVKPEQFKYLQARVMVAGPWTTPLALVGMSLYLSDPKT